VISSVRQIHARAVNGTSRFDQTLTFGDFRLDPVRRRLIRGGEAMPLADRLFGVLSLLIQSNGAVVEKERFATVVWPDAVMTDANLAQHIYQLRQLLGETARDRSYIMAASGRGYRLTVPVRAEDEASAASKATFDTHAALLNNGLEPLIYYSHGCQQLERCTVRALVRAAEFFEAALEIDGNYVPALLGLARAHVSLAERAFVPPARAFQRAGAAVERALELSPNSAMAHAVRSEVLAFGDWDWPGAQREIEVAARLEPRSAWLHANAARLYSCAGLYDRAMIEAQFALMTEPSSLALLLQIVSVFAYSGQYQPAIGVLSKLLKGDASFHAARHARAQIHLLNARPTEALLDLNLIPPRESEDVNLRWPLIARAYADLGDAARADEIYGKLLEAARAKYVAFWNLAIVATGLGRFDDALSHLEKALQDHEPALLFLKSLPWYTPISQSARFRAIVEAVSLSRSDS
jgi:DNA-binding winged helix-turn-helix (wHTH) protein/Tfp pilus assembly protein PilF